MFKNTFKRALCAHQAHFKHTSIACKHEVKNVQLCAVPAVNGPLVINLLCRVERQPTNKSPTIPVWLS